MNPAIIAWLLLAINAWGARPIPPDEREQAAAFRQQAAEDFAAVAYDRDEPPLYQGRYARAVTALDMVSVASFESRITERIARGHCKRHECDSGRAAGLMQAHPGPLGSRFVGVRFEQCTVAADDCMTVADLVSDNVMQLRAGLRILRVQGFGAFTRGGEARAQAIEWMTHHPPPLADADAWTHE